MVLDFVHWGKVAHGLPKSQGLRRCDTILQLLTGAHRVEVRDMGELDAEDETMLNRGLRKLFKTLA